MSETLDLEIADDKAEAAEVVPVPAPQTGEVAPVDREGHTAAVLDMIVRAATDPAVDVEKMERLMAMHERIAAQQAEGAFNDAMAAAQAEMRPVAADANNPQTKSKYASYAQLDRALRPIYTRHGFSLSFDTGKDAPEDSVVVLCYVGHRAGHTRTYQARMPADGKGAKGGDVMTKTHAAGSAFTYGQRYLMKMIFNVAVGDDDDGNSADQDFTVISAEQKGELIELMKAVNADPDRFLNYLGIDYLDRLPVKRFDEARRVLEKKRGTAK